MNKRPNIVIFNPDEMRADTMAHLGNPAAVTPNLDRLALQDGISIRNAFCQNPVCVPSRCSFLSGWYPHVAGHRTMSHMLKDHEPLLLRSLMEQGYYVWMTSRNHFLARDSEDWWHGAAHEVCDSTKVELNPAPGFIEYLYGKGLPKERGEQGGDNYYSFYRGRLDIPPELGKYYDQDECWTEGAVDFIHRHPDDQPFCLFLPIFYPHPEYGVCEPYYSMINRKKVPSPIPAPSDWKGKPSILHGLHELQGLKDWSDSRRRELAVTYLGQVARVDDLFGRVVQALKDEGIYDNTLILVFSDHGDYAGNYGLVEKTQNTFEDCLVNVPFIIKPPADCDCTPGIRDEALVELVDVYATVEDYCGLDRTHSHFGRSLRALVAGDTAEHREAVFSEGGRLHGEEQCMEIDSNPELNKTMEYWPRMYLQRSEGPEHTKAIMCRTREFKYVRRHYEPDEFYDLRHDPQELENRIDDPAYHGVIADMKELLLSHYVETCDSVPFHIDSRWPAQKELEQIHSLYAHRYPLTGQPKESQRREE